MPRCPCTVAIGKARAACAQSFALWQQAAIEIMRRNHSIIVCSYIYIVVVRAHPVRGDSHTQRNASGEVATALICFVGGILIIAKQNLLNSASQAAIAWLESVKLLIFTKSPNIWLTNPVCTQRKKHFLLQWRMIDIGLAVSRSCVGFSGSSYPRDTVAKLSLYFSLKSHQRTMNCIHYRDVMYLAEMCSRPKGRDFITKWETRKLEFKTVIRVLKICGFSRKFLKKCHLQFEAEFFRISGIFRTCCGCC